METTTKLTREDLEALVHPSGPLKYYPLAVLKNLKESAPDLALACLKACALLATYPPVVTARCNEDEQAAGEIQDGYDALPYELRAVLAAANVEVP